MDGFDSDVGPLHDTSDGVQVLLVGGCDGRCSGLAVQVTSVVVDRQKRSVSHGRYLKQDARAARRQVQNGRPRVRILVS